MTSKPPTVATPARAPRLAILSHSSGEYDARSLRLARSAVDAGYEVTMYARLHPGLAAVEERDGFRIVRADPNPALAFPFRRGRALKASRKRLKAASGPAAELKAPPTAPPAVPTAMPDTMSKDEAGTPRPRRRGGALRRVLRVPARLVGRAIGQVKAWQRITLMFPLRPLGWAVALDDVVEPADIWHGMWAGSLPALVRLSKRHGGRTIYDSRDVYMLSRDFASLVWPLRPILAGMERRWARQVDRVLTVNEPYADLITRQLGVARPPVVRNCPERWTPPVPAPDHIRTAAGIAPDTFVALYQGHLTTERGIEQAMTAVLQVPNTVLVLLGFGNRENMFRRRAEQPPYAGKVMLLPPVPPSELVEWSASADVMLMPIQPTTINHQFTTPQKLWEAMAAGVPVVASDLPGMAAVVEPEQVGVLCDPTSPWSIAEGMRRILHRTPEERAALRRHVLDVAHERYNWEGQVGELFALYADLGCPPPVRASAGSPATPAIMPDATRSDEPTPGRTLHLVASLEPMPADEADTTIVLTDTTAILTAAQTAAGVVALRDVVDSVMREHDIYEVASNALDTWTEATDIAGLLSHQGVSFWYEQRLRHWTWVVQRLLWLAVADRLVAMHPGTRELVVGDGIDRDLLAALRSIADRDGVALRFATGTRAAGFFARVPSSSGSADPPREPSGTLLRLRRRIVPSAMQRRQKVVLQRIVRIEEDRRDRLLVVQAHRRQRVDTPTGPRAINVYLGPVIDRLRGSRLEPFEVDIRSSMTDEAEWAHISGSESERVLPSETPGILGGTKRLAEARQEAMEATRRIAALRVPLVAHGVDVGHELVRQIADWNEVNHTRRIEEVARLRATIRRLHPAGILLADEYHRQDWMTAAMAEGVPLAAVQHGVIYRWHTGYMHRTRPPQLRLPDRFYTFGSWERDLLVGTSVYRPDEVVVGGSPRLSLVSPRPSDRDAVRKELGIAEGDRLLVLSGTWGQLYRKLHYPIALARLFAAPLEHVHLVVKLHPSELDEGPYRRIVEGIASAGGFAPPPITEVRDVDLYRLLGAADAHLGIHSTVLTEAVFTGTPNLISTGLAGADLLGYVAAGVAIPVESAADLAAALDVPRDQALDPARREAFIAAHYEPGDASRRIADDLLAWLP